MSLMFSTRRIKKVGEIQELQHVIHPIFVDGSGVPKVLRHMPPLGVDRGRRIIW